MDRRGFTLIETVVAMLVVSMVVAVVFSVALTSRQNFSRTDRRFRMAGAARTAMDEVRRYVVTGSTAIASDLCEGCGTGGTGACNPWEGGGCVHNVTNMLPADLRAAPFNGTLIYQVTNSNVGGNIVPNLNFTLAWNDEQ